MAGRYASRSEDRLEMVRLFTAEKRTHAQVAQRLGYSRAGVRKWWRRYRRGGPAALCPPPPPAPGPLARFGPRVRTAALAYRRTHPQIGARRALVALADDPTLRGERLPQARTLHGAWVHAGLVSRQFRREQPATAPVLAGSALHGVWQIDHQDHLEARGIPGLLVLQSIRAPQAGLTIGADVFPGPHGAHAVPEEALFDALRQRMVQWGRPHTLSVDGGIRFLGQAQRSFPRRFELLCAGWGIAVHQIRAGRPTDNGAVERLHGTLDAVFVGPVYADLPALQQTLDDHLPLLNERFPSRARTCGGHPPLVVHPTARHSGRAYDPRTEWETFDMRAVDALLVGWLWHRKVGLRSGQISFADKNVGVGKQYRGQTVALRFDPTDRLVVIAELGASLEAHGPEIGRFSCAAFEKAAILGTSTVAWRPAAEGEVRVHCTPL